jgi:alpha-L-rhamnosidase
MFGAVAQSLFEDLAGIRPTAPGYAQIAFKPQVPKGLDHAEATYDSVRGRVAASWRRAPDGTLTLEVTVPPNARGTVYVPARDAAAVSASGADLVGVEGDRVVYRVGSGTYAFRVGAPGR